MLGAVRLAKLEKQQENRPRISPDPLRRRSVRLCNANVTSPKFSSHAAAATALRVQTFSLVFLGGVCNVANVWKTRRYSDRPEPTHIHAHAHTQRQQNGEYMSQTERFHGDARARILQAVTSHRRAAAQTGMKRNESCLKRSPEMKTQQDLNYRDYATCLFLYS